MLIFSLPVFSLNIILLYNKLFLYINKLFKNFEEKEKKKSVIIFSIYKYIS